MWLSPVTESYGFPVLGVTPTFLTGLLLMLAGLAGLVVIHFGIGGSPRLSSRLSRMSTFLGPVFLFACCYFAAFPPRAWSAWTTVCFAWGAVLALFVVSFAIQPRRRRPSHPHADDREGDHGQASPP